MEKPAALDCRKASNGGSAPTSPVTANGASRPSPSASSTAGRPISVD